MAQCKQTAHELLEAAFSPSVAVLCSPDAETLCRKNNLSFVELVQPFCRLNAEASLKDPTNQSFNVRNLRLVIKPLGAVPPQPSLAKKMLSEAVSACQFPLDGCRATLVKVRDCEVQLPSSLPWFEAYRDCFFDIAYPSDHEFTKHFLACIFVVSSSNANPVAELTKLSQQQHQMQHQSPSKLPKWFCPNIFKGYVLLFDIAEGDQTQTEAVFQTMKSTFPGSFCHLLQINSQPIPQRPIAALDGDGPHPPDPWSQFLTRQMDHLDVSEYDNSPRTPQDDSGFPNQLTEGSSELDLSQIPEVAVEVTETLAPTNDVLLHPLSPEANESSSPNSTSGRIDKPLKMECVPEQDAPLAVPINNTGVTWPQERPQPQPHGLCLTVSDMDRIRIFIHEFVIRGLLPFVEKQMKFLNEAVTMRKGLHRTLLSATRKWFVGAKPSAQGPNAPSNSVVYSQEATELQVRRLGDLAFMFQHYDLAYQAYHTAKRDFNNDQAWLYYAGALEMAALAVFMQGANSQRQYPVHYMDSAINTYMNTCKSAQFATRTTLLSTECLKSKGMYGEAAMQFIKMTSEDSDLRSALLLEQAAHCFMVMRTPMVRKYAFHMILAGHRFSKAGQRKHALRAYKQAYQVYKSKEWGLAEDHINFTIGRQSCNLKQLDQALDAFRKLLSEGSEQPPSQQAIFLREYLFVYNQLAPQELRADRSPFLLPVPVIEGQATKVILGHLPQLSQGSERSILASSVSFDDDDDDSLWFRLEELAVTQMQGGLLTGFRPTLQHLTSNTLNYQRLIAAMKEPIVVQISMRNPLQIPLSLMAVSLLWRFYPEPEQVEEQSFTNDQEDGCKMSVGETMIEAETIEELDIASSQTTKVELSLTPNHTGKLKILGVSYSLGLCATPAAGDGGPEAQNGQTATLTFARGKQYLEVRGPRLNNTKAEKVSQVYGPDHRLELSVVPPMPCLQVSFVHFPHTMLCGEIQQTTVEFRNVGEFAIEHLCVASGTPDLFSFGLPLSQQAIVEPATSVYSDFIGKPSEMLVEVPSLQRVCRLPFPDGWTVFLPGASYHLPLWIRGPDEAGSHHCNFLFYYESADHDVTTKKHRVLRHRAPLVVSNSFSVEAIAMHSQTQLATENVSCLAIAVDVENLNEVQDSTITELSIIQVSSASPKWLLQPMGKTLLQEIPVSPRETAHLCFRAVHRQPHGVAENDQSLMFSNIPFGHREIDSSASPCADFIHRSQLSLPPLDDPLGTMGAKGAKAEENLEADLAVALHVGLVIVVIWKAFVVSTTGESSVVMGQHHLCLEKINTPTTTHPQTKPVEEKPPIRIIPDLETSVPSIEHGPSKAVLSQLVQCTVQHPHRVQHDFSSGTRTCLVRVVLLVHNCSPVDVQVVLDTSHPLDSYSPAAPSQSPVASTFAWVGATHWTVSLASGQTRNFTLRAAFFAPGSYNVGSVWVGARLVDHPEDLLTLQGPFTPSLVVVDNNAHPS